MSRPLFRALGLAAACLMLPVGASLAQPAEAPAAAASAASPAQPAAATTEAPAKAGFQQVERAENLRYRHLWMAYAVIWLLVFGFAFRTWQRTRDTGAELDELKRRLAELEARNG
ncbi:MAG: hypothetical protein KC613_01075 [Myxococcales bacterium]|nr:hypothetical protein [Myxococcales bacterium]MCB9522119.1 hypothetical protein [Myxococcales bacterium]